MERNDIDSAKYFLSDSIIFESTDIKESVYKELHNWTLKNTKGLEELGWTIGKPMPDFSDRPYDRDVFLIFYVVYR